MSRKPNCPDVNLVGNWLWRGGRLRVLKRMTTNNGKSFEPGEVIRLVRLDPYQEGANLATLNFVSDSDPSKVLCLTGWDNQNANFEIVESAGE